MRKPCCDKQETNKGAWTKQEDQKLIDYIHAHGEGNWRSLPQQAGLLRCGKSCRLRWLNYLRPDIKRGNFAEDEEDLIIKLHALLGNRWSLIAGRLPGRTDNEVKNYWNSHLKRKLGNMGINPDNHRIIDHHRRRSSSTATVSPTSDHLHDKETASKPQHKDDDQDQKGGEDSTPTNINKTSSDENLGDEKSDDDYRTKSMLDLNLSLTIPTTTPPLGEEEIVVHSTTTEKLAIDGSSIALTLNLWS